MPKLSPVGPVEGVADGLNSVEVFSTRLEILCGGVASFALVATEEDATEIGQPSSTLLCRSAAPFAGVVDLKNCDFIPKGLSGRKVDVGGSNVGMALFHDADGSILLRGVFRRRCCVVR